MIVDFEKIFDYISREFIVECLELLGFELTFVRCNRALTSRATALITQNGYLSRSIWVERGCRQGDVVSRYLFVIRTLMLNYLIQSNKNSIMYGKSNVHEFVDYD